MLDSGEVILYWLAVQKSVRKPSDRARFMPFAAIRIFCAEYTVCPSGTSGYSCASHWIQVFLWIISEKGLFAPVPIGSLLGIRESGIILLAHPLDGSFPG